MPGPPLFRRILRFDILILGGGLAGAGLAAALRRSRWRIGLVEGRPPGPATAAWDSRVYALSPASQRFLQELGTWRHLDAGRLTPVYDMVVRGDAGGRIEFSAWDGGVDVLAWIVEADAMRRELWKEVQRQDNLALFSPAQPQGLALRQDAVLLELTSGETLQAALVVGADGADSWLRTQAGLAAAILSYGEMGVVANFECERPHRNTAFQWFRADGILAWLPLPGERISMVWSTPQAHARELLALDPADLCCRVAAAGGKRLGALAPLTPPVAFPLRLMRVPRTVAPRLALIGDAAHAIHPLSGHGINLGFADARTLAGVLQSEAAEDCGDERLLRRYARARAEEVALLQWVTHGLQRLFRPSHPAVSLIRNLGLNLTDSLPIVRNMLLRYALGRP